MKRKSLIVCFITVLCIIAMILVMQFTNKAVPLKQMVPYMVKGTEFCFNVNSWGYWNYVCLGQEDAERVKDILDFIILTPLNVSTEYDDKDEAGFSNTMLSAENVYTSMVIIQEDTEYLIELKDDYETEMVYINIWKYEGEDASGQADIRYFEGDFKYTPATHMLELKQELINQEVPNASIKSLQTNLTRNLTLREHSFFTAMLERIDSSEDNISEDKSFVESEKMYQINIDEHIYYIDLTDMYIYDMDGNVYEIGDEFKISLEAMCSQ